MKQKPKPKTIELVNPRYQPSKADLEGDMRINASPEKVARAVMRRVNVWHIRRPKAQSG